MTEDQFFRLALFLGLVLMGGVGLYHALVSRASGEKLDRMLQEGRFIFVTLRAFHLLFFGGLVLCVVEPSWMAWASVALPRWLQWIGVGLGLIAALLMTWTLRTLGRNLTDTVVTRKEHTLITSGPYRWVRHPFYVSFVIGVVSASLVTANWYVAVTGSLVFALLAIRSGKEEQKLLERFGDEYRAYMERTGRFLPRLGDK